MVNLLINFIASFITFTRDIFRVCLEDSKIPQSDFLLRIF